MKKAQQLSISAIVLTITACICGCGSKGQQTDTTVSEVADTLPVDTRELIEPICDTIYPSASRVNYRVKVLIDSIDGQIYDLNDQYADTPGAFTFRNGPSRAADFGGTVKGIPSEIVIDWTFTTDTDFRDTGFGQWGGGTGWTGQPVYVEWPVAIKHDLEAKGLTDTLFSGKEIIVGSLDSHLYFIDAVSGNASRRPINVGNPIKGSVSLDPRLNGYLYVGHGVPAERPFGAITIDVFSDSIVHVYGEDLSANRHWNAYDSSAIRVDNFVFRPGENGCVYKYIDEGQGQVPRLHSILYYTVNGAAPGIESSMSVYRNYGFVSDNHGNVIAINLNTLTPVWHYTLNDDADASPTLTIEDGHPYLYVSCEIDRLPQGEARFAKLDALTGQQIWATTAPGQRIDRDDKHFDGGFYASPLPGSGDCSHLIFSNCVNNLNGQNGEFIAFNRQTGDIVYRLPLIHYAWSSPVGFLNEDGKMFVVTGDTYGNIYLIDALAGTIITRQQVGMNFESSPVVFGNSLVVGSRGNSIYKMSIK